MINFFHAHSDAYNRPGEAARLGLHRAALTNDTRRLRDLVPSDTQRLDPLGRVSIGHVRPFVPVSERHIIPGPLRVLIREIRLQSRLLFGDRLLPLRRHGKDPRGAR